MDYPGAGHENVRVNERADLWIYDEFTTNFAFLPSPPPLSKMNLNITHRLNHFLNVQNMLNVEPERCAAILSNAVTGGYAPVDYVRALAIAAQSQQYMPEELGSYVDAALKMFRKQMKAQQPPSGIDAGDSNSEALLLWAAFRKATSWQSVLRAFESASPDDDDMPLMPPQVPSRMAPVLKRNAKDEYLQSEIIILMESLIEDIAKQMNHEQMLVAKSQELKMSTKQARGVAFFIQGLILWSTRGGREAFEYVIQQIPTFFDKLPGNRLSTTTPPPPSSALSSTTPNPPIDDERSENDVEAGTG